jgi:hypothetical protein
MRGRQGGVRAVELSIAKKGAKRRTGVSIRRSVLWYCIAKECPSYNLFHLCDQVRQSFCTGMTNSRDDENKCRGHENQLLVFTTVVFVYPEGSKTRMTSCVCACMCLSIPAASGPSCPASRPGCWDRHVWSDCPDENDTTEGKTSADMTGWD